MRLGHLVSPQPVQLEMGSVERFIGNQQQSHPVALFHGADHIAFFIEQEGGHLDRQLHHHPPGAILHCLFLNQSQHAQGQ